MSTHTWRPPPGDGDVSPGPEESAPPTGSTRRPAPGAHGAVDGSGRPTHRFWSSRRLPAALAALLCAAAVGLLLYDVIAVRAGASAMHWRRRLAEELATRPLDDVWMILGAAVAMALGLWLFLLAVTPGLRRLLPMRRPDGDPAAADVRAGLDRRAAALILRDRAVGVPGVQSVQVDVGRRKVRARARAHFRDLEEVRADLKAELGDAVTSLGLNRTPAVAVRVRRPRKG
ncbi:DUF6286 domain-containing protein [Streptomyces sp. NPDC086783]|uniref:DUF6286 domain-containing protein n=1 Tax=Streptomyces sp. NPDC086783 TaxID=3365758 RepID=UPI0038142DAD